MDIRQIPERCTLTPASAQSQGAEWLALMGVAASRTRSADGAHIVFPIEHADYVEDLAEREARCCTFLRIATHRSGEHIELQVTATDQEGLELVAAIVDL